MSQEIEQMKTTGDKKDFYELQKNNLTMTSI